MTELVYNLNRFFDEDFVDFEYNELEESILQVVNDLNTMEILVEDEFERESVIPEDIYTPLILSESVEQCLDLSFEGDRLPIFTDQCEMDVFRPLPTYAVVEMQTSVLDQ